MIERVGVVGSRKGFSKEEVCGFLEKYLKEKCVVVSGGAPGVDSYAESFARDNDFECLIVRPRNPAVKLDYLFRNVEIVALSDVLFIFWDGRSRGTKFVLDYARARNKKVELVTRDKVRKFTS